MFFIVKIRSSHDWLRRRIVHKRRNLIFNLSFFMKMSFSILLSVTTLFQFAWIQKNEYVNCKVRNIHDKEVNKREKRESISLVHFFTHKFTIPWKSSKFFSSKIGIMKWDFILTWWCHRNPRKEENWRDKEKILQEKGKESNIMTNTKRTILLIWY